MLAALFAALGALLAGGWSLASLRGRLRRLQAIRRRHAQVHVLRDELEDRLDALEEACHVAALAPPPAGLKVSDASDRLVELREGLREADAALRDFETAWSQGAFDGARSHLQGALHRLDAGHGATRLLATEVERQAESFSTPAGWQVLEQRAIAACRATHQALAPGAYSGHADLLVVHVEQSLVAWSRLAHTNAGPLERIEAAKRVAWCLASLERFTATTANADEIGRQVLELWPRVLGEAHDALDAVDGRLVDRLAEIEDLGRDAQTLWADGDLVRADATIRRAQTRARQLARWFAIGIVDAPTWGGQGLAGVVLGLLEASRLPPIGTLAGFGAGLTLVAAVSCAIGHALDSPSEVLVARGNLALDRPASASSEVDAAHSAAMAFDGIRTTSWQPGGSLQDPQWLTVDLGRLEPVHAVEVLPLAAPAARCLWSVAVSTDDVTWQTIGTGSSMGGVRSSHWGRVLAPLGTEARLVQIMPIDWGASGVAIDEVRVFAPPRFEK